VKLCLLQNLPQICQVRFDPIRDLLFQHGAHQMRLKICIVGLPYKPCFCECRRILADFCKIFWIRVRSEV
jgi:hypothetical protein